MSEGVSCHVAGLLDQPLEVAAAVAVGVVEGLDVQLVEDGVLVPERVVAHGRSSGDDPGPKRSPARVAPHRRPTNRAPRVP